MVDDDTMHIGEPLKDLKIRKNILIASVSHGLSAEIPHGSTHLSIGDTVIILTDSRTTVNTINDIFEE